MITETTYHTTVTDGQNMKVDSRSVANHVCYGKTTRLCAPTTIDNTKTIIIFYRLRLSISYVMLLSVYGRGRTPVLMLSVRVLFFSSFNNVTIIILINPTLRFGALFSFPISLHARRLLVEINETQLRDECI